MKQKYDLVVLPTAVAIHETQAEAPEVSRLYTCWCVAINICFGLIGLCVLLLMLPLLAFCIYLDSPGPIFYVQERMGYRGRLFPMYKFRSMHVDSKRAKEIIPTVSHDPRITRVGKLLRKTHLDELPQVLNILRGDINLIGPRPEILEATMRLGKIIPHYWERLYVKPGLTGWTQVKYHYGDTDEDEKIKLDYDLYYVQHRSARLDCAILVRTVREVVLGYGR
ncbi:MAG TPA: sugar transferase [Ktedonobacteraceae bacterium]|jgi:lipopolysaccharide/colanic/teichoic acid biosynthesis glycosyltransferase